MGFTIILIASSTLEYESAVNSTVPLAFLHLRLVRESLIRLVWIYRLTSLNHLRVWDKLDSNNFRILQHQAKKTTKEIKNKIKNNKRKKEKEKEKEIKIAATSLSIFSGIWVISEVAFASSYAISWSIVPTVVFEDFFFFFV